MMTAEPETPPLRRFRLAGRLLLLLVVLAGAGLAWRGWGALDAPAIARVLGQYRAAPLVFLAVHVVASLTFFPHTRKVVGSVRCV